MSCCHAVIWNRTWRTGVAGLWYPAPMPRQVVSSVRHVPSNPNTGESVVSNLELRALRALQAVAVQSSGLLLQNLSSDSDPCLLVSSSHVTSLIFAPLYQNLKS